MALTLSFGEIKEGMKFHFNNDYPDINYVVTKIRKKSIKILEMNSGSNHSIELSVDTTHINEPHIGYIIKRHMNDYSLIEKHDTVDDFIKCGYWTQVN